MVSLERPQNVGIVQGVGVGVEKEKGTEEGMGGRKREDREEESLL